MKISKGRSFYFASKSKSPYYSTDDDYHYFLRHGDEYLDRRPLDAPEEAFRSRLVPPDVHSDNISAFFEPEELGQQPEEKDELNHDEIGTHLVERKVQVKVEPKVMFAAERTFFTWVRSSLFLFGASLTVLKYSKHDPVRLVYGSFLLVVAVIFIIYPLIRCKFCY